LFKTEVEVFINKDNFETLFEIKNNQHPEILKKYFQKAVSLETMVILDMILGYVKKFDKKMTDPVWETVRLRIIKYKPFLNIDVAKYKKVLQEIVL
jgi:T4 gene Gp59 loader of gp41 DNA helicase C-term